MDIFSAACIAGVAAFALLFLLAVVRQLLFIGRPNEVLVISGKKRTLDDGTVVGYRLPRNIKITAVGFRVRRVKINTDLFERCGCRS